MHSFQFTNKGENPRVVFNERQIPVTINPGQSCVVMLDEATERQMARICAKDKTLRMKAMPTNGHAPVDPMPEPASEPLPEPVPPSGPKPRKRSTRRASMRF
jgi:hypothetical protein